MSNTGQKNGETHIDSFDEFEHALEHGLMYTPDGRWTGCSAHLHAIPSVTVVIGAHPE